MEDYFSRIKVGFLILLAYCLISTYSFSFLPLFFRMEGYSLYQLALLYALGCGGCLISTFLVNTYWIKKYLIWSFPLCGLIALSIALLEGRAFWLYPIFTLLIVIIFWLPLNYIFFRSSQNHNAVDSSMYMTFPAVITILVPFLAIWTIQNKGYSWLFGIAAILFCLPAFFVARKVSEEKISTHFFSSLKKFKGLKTLTVSEGALQYFSGIIIPIYALLFFQTETEIGHFLSYLGIIGFVIALVISKRSDHNHKRKSYILVLSLILALSIGALSLVKNQGWWLLGVGAFTIVSTLAQPLRLAISMDVKVVDMGFWRIREFFLNLGRLMTLLVTMFLFYFGIYWPVFIMYGLIALVYPFLVGMKLKELG